MPAQSQPQPPSSQSPTPPPTFRRCRPRHPHYTRCPRRAIPPRRPPCCPPSPCSTLARRRGGIRAFDAPSPPLSALKGGKATRRAVRAYPPRVSALASTHQARRREAHECAAHRARAARGVVCSHPRTPTCAWARPQSAELAAHPRRGTCACCVRVYLAESAGEGARASPSLALRPAHAPRSRAAEPTGAAKTCVASVRTSQPECVGAGTESGQDITLTFAPSPLVVLLHPVRRISTCNTSHLPPPRAQVRFGSEIHASRFEICESCR
ncbi:hypothetical protein B0H17DRAFT_1334189, partial [Mycena rosella]